MTNSSLSMIPPAKQVAPRVQFPATLSLAHNFLQAGAKPVVRDVSAIMNRPAPHLDNQVRQTLQSITCQSDPSVGIIGWEIRQNGLRYGVCIKDDLNNDVFNIGVETPHEQPFLRRATTMSIAEKAHAVALVRQTLMEREPDRFRFLRWNFEQLEKACSNPATGVVVTSAPAQRLLANAKLYSHFGLSFPDDANYADKPESVLLALEWSQGQKYTLIDCTRVFPLFLVGNANNPAGPLECMERSEAQMTLILAKDLARSAGEPRLHAIWSRLEASVERHGSSRRPAP